MSAVLTPTATGSGQDIAALDFEVLIQQPEENHTNVSLAPTSMFLSENDPVELAISALYANESVWVMAEEFVSLLALDAGMPATEASCVV
jgi:hypothetical protein